jgi:transposase InsO family protein
LSRQLASHGGPRLPPSTVNNTLPRGGLIDRALSAGATPWQRFERGGPNELWQMDFKGHLVLINGRRCHPLTVLDDHSRFSRVLDAGAKERAETVQAAMIAAFRRCGLPGAILTDNGPPWGACY